MNRIVKVKRFYSLEVLQKKEDEGLPEDVNVRHKEVRRKYLILCCIMLETKTNEDHDQ